MRTLGSRITPCGEVARLAAFDPAQIGGEAGSNSCRAKHSRSLGYSGSRAIITRRHSPHFFRLRKWRTAKAPTCWPTRRPRKHEVRQ
jgi:hypothetical protein